MSRQHLRQMPADFRAARPLSFPCAAPRLVPVERVVANDWNPNQVATPEMEGLAASIAACGVTQPIVAWHDETADLYVIVDGFHRYVILRDVFGLSPIPLVVIDRDAAGCVAATVRHNKAKGEHQVAGMAHIVGLLAAEGLDDGAIAARLGMESEEVRRLKQIAGTAQFARTP